MSAPSNSSDTTWLLTDEERWIANINNLIYYSVLFPVAFCGNVFTLSAVVMTLRIRKSIPNLLIGVLASADLASLLLVHTITVASISSGEWIGDDNLCRFQSVVSFTYFKLGFFSKTNISIDRFIALKYPLKYRTLVTTRKVVLVVLFNVLFSIGSSALTWVFDPEYIHQLETSYICTNDFSVYTSYKLSIIIIEGGLFIMGCTVFFIGNLTVVKVMLSLSRKLKKTRSTQAIRKIATVTAPIFSDISQTLTLQEQTLQSNSISLPATPLSRNRRQKSYTLAYINEAVTEDEEYKERGENSSNNNVTKHHRWNTLPAQRYRKNGQVEDTKDIQQKLSLHIHTNQKQRKQKKELQFAKLILVISSVFIVLWMPFMVTIFHEHNTRTRLHPFIIDISMKLVYANACLNPILYGVFNANFRKAYVYYIRMLSHYASCKLMKRPSEKDLVMSRRASSQSLAEVFSTTDNSIFTS